MKSTSKPYGIVVSTDNIARQEWLSYRRTGIGGSDAGSVIGMNQYKSRYSLWADKMGMLPEVEDNERMRLGRDLEQYVAERWSEKTGKRFRRRNYMFRSHRWPWMLADVDREVVGENAGLECKTTTIKPEGIDDGNVPERFYCQCLHYMAVMGYERMYLAILVFGAGLYEFTIERDEAQIQALANAEGAFWTKYVDAQTPPDVDGTDSTYDALAAIFPESTQREVELFNVQELLELDIIKDQIKELTARKQEIENSIKVTMGDAARALAPGYTVSWPSYSKTDIDRGLLKEKYPEVYAECTKSSTYRRFTVKKEDAS